MIKPFGAVKGFGVGNNSACSLDSAFEVVKKLNEVIEHINEAEETIKHGYWEPDKVDADYMVCSNCGIHFLNCKKNIYLYCPHCGAKMEGVKNG